MAQGSIAPEGKYGRFSSGSKLEGKVLGALMGIALIGSLVISYIGIKQNYQAKPVSTNEVHNTPLTMTNQHIEGAVQGYYPGK